ncbi:Gfo/Idh/MocA family oxidoreductase [Vallitalea pronyensis]|uniref:Gfo/Idh/MocA family oxidoreductase n=1 Tax=Vallitalea pronyensis TaxID=1348613 RepID=A0A8J8MN33_9FIRM|nr:Gfo/Idh/MocA family oxidoreductase [Vallitalea pronyensis]QUI24720.1 Gfo/Idh/MocA family oxidoreductase [Vallitalea pronyensis]
MKPLRIAMIGCGRISQVYKESFKHLGDQVEVVYAVDIKLERAKAFAESFEGCVATDDYRLCFQGHVDIIHLATPHHMHPIIAIEAMKQKIHVLTEKPMAIYLQDANRMIQVAKEEGVQLGVIFQTRYVKGYQTIKEIIREGKLGKIIGARSYLSWDRSDDYYQQSDWKGSWDKEGGGVLIDQAIHSIDRVQDLIGDDVEWIEASMQNRNHHVVDVEDVAEAFIQFKNGCMYQLYACNCYSYDAPIEIEIVGEKGKVGLIQDLAWVRLDDDEYVEIKDERKGVAAGPSYWGYSHIMQIQDFYDAVRENQKVTIDGVEGRKALEIIRGIYHAATLNKRVSFPFEDLKGALIQ